MTKSEALEILRRRTGQRLGSREAHFASINKSKDVWWLEISLDEIFDESEPHLHLLLAGRGDELHHLRVPKVWISENIESFVVREEKAVISLELSSAASSRFQDVRPRSGRLQLHEFLV